MLLIIINIHLGNRGKSYTARLMLFMCWFTIAVLTVDMMAWLVMDIQGVLGWYLVYVFNFLLFLLNPTVPVIWLMYTFVCLNNRHLSKREILLFSTPFIINLILMGFSLFTGVVFTVNEFNQYHRGPGVFIVTLIDYSTILAAFYYALTHRNSIGRRFMAIVVTFSLLPLCGSLLQIFNYGISTSWPSIALGVLLTYIFMEVQKNVRDHLTGLVNRQQYEEIIHNRLSKSSKNKGFSLIVIDMNFFKEINDNYGHEVGDRALQEAAVLLNRSVNIKDTVARLGGDEFIIILESSNNLVAPQVIRRILEQLGQWNSVSEEPFQLSMSLGYAAYSDEKHIIYKDLFKEADEMMYRHKKEIKKGKPPLEFREHNI